ncbi:Serine/threonine-protein kinase AfsK [Streptomyces hundungensis]|uniref:Serine/threonine-protein kinase AfsK n=1 Tax=Streptomyces hundungensis TaxID=1077946 RepID=A0A387HBJ0_9ACTN|nr:Serine/threonine-protein kinase AfsK [Streptomyces hundungensis]
MEPLIAEDPAHIGSYRLIARLGAGGMGLVYLGRSDVGRTVAVKVVQAEYAAQPDFRKRFAYEVAAARRVGGAWTAAVLDADTEARVPWVATQYVAGPSLHDVVARDFGPLPEASVCSLGDGLARALTDIHAAGLIHRDLKPSNVLLTVDGPRVIDFGIARALGTVAEGPLTRTGAVIGSPGFMSPEQVRGLKLTPASDVFCLGSVLAYAATGRSPFGTLDSGLHALMFRVAEEAPDLDGVPDSLLGLVRACLHKDPSLRPSLQDITTRTGGQAARPWLPALVLEQLGRNASQLLDFAPSPSRVTPAPSPESLPAHTPTVLDPSQSAPGPAPDPYAPTSLAPSPAPHRSPNQAGPQPPANRTAPVPSTRPRLRMVVLATVLVVLGIVASVLSQGR